MGCTQSPIAPACVFVCARAGEGVWRGGLKIVYMQRGSNVLERAQAERGKAAGCHPRRHIIRARNKPSHLVGPLLPVIN